MIKYKTKKILLIGIVFLFTLLLISCGKGSPENTDPFGEGRDPSTLGEENEEMVGSKAEEILEIEDKDKLIKIRIDDGRPAILFNRQKWNEIYDMDNLASQYNGIDFIVDENQMIIATEGDKVVDGVILGIDRLDEFKAFGFTNPSVFFLMEDGTVEWLVAPPRLVYTGDEIRDDFYGASLKVPWLKDIESFAIDVESEGFGDMTVFAKDKAGLHYDLRIPCSFTYNIDYTWQCVLDENENSLGILDFDEEGNFSFEIGSTYEIAERYSGTYEISLDDESSKGFRAGMIRVDLDLDPSIRFEGSPEKINGSFFIQSTGSETLTLWAGDGDPLFPGMDMYEFTFRDFKGGY